MLAAFSPLKPVRDVLLEGTPQSWRRRRQKVISNDPGGQFTVRCLKQAGQTSISGVLAYRAMRSRARVGSSVVSALWCEQLLAGVLTLCRGQCPGLAVAERELRLREIRDSLGVSPALPCGAAPKLLYLP